MHFRSPEVAMVRIPKTGSTSIVHGLLGGLSNVIEVSYGHFPDAWLNLYSFGFVRNPFDRLVSCLCMFQTFDASNEAETQFRSTITLDTIMDVIEDPNVPICAHKSDTYMPKLKLHALPMTHPFLNLHKAKDIYRFEQFAEEFIRLAQKLNLPAGQVPHQRKTEKRDEYRKYYSDAQRKRAESVFANDLREFKYTY